MSKLSSLFFALFAHCSSLALAQPSNILLIIADDFGVDSFPLTAAVAASKPPMPNISALKNSGVLFGSAYSQPTCSPTRACLLTGRHPYRTGIGEQLIGATSAQLQASEFTLPEAFAANPGLGYSLAMFGKWHLNAGVGTNDTARTIGGWPSFAGTNTGAIPDFYAWTKITNGTTAATTTYATTDTANDVISFITTRPSATPWFAWVAFNAPHSPYHVPPAGLHSYGTPTTNRTMYEAACQALDTEVGRVLSNVNLANTYVIFVGDNGTPGNVIQTPYTNTHAKDSLYQGGTRVPLIIAGPGIVSPNRTNASLVHVVDLYSTIMELAGINVASTQPAANPLDSKSLVPILKNTANSVNTTVQSEMFGINLTTAESGRVLTNASGYTLIQYNDGREELYSTTTDSNQITNLLGANITATAQANYVALRTAFTNYVSSSPPNNPLLSSWFTRNSGEYARLYESDATQTAGTSITTWSRGQGTQTAPTYSGVQQIDYSADWVYIHTTGLPSHVMGPWYLNAGHTNPFPNYPANAGVIYRFPRVPAAIPTTKTLFGLGTIGYYVDGVSMFDIRDGFGWNGTAEANVGNTVVAWNREAYIVEGVTFDRANAHQAGANHHYHANPVALRHFLGDHVDYISNPGNANNNSYAENTTNLHHSPILGWMRDGLPIYGPYAYSSPLDPNSGIRRMTSGFALRNGSNGTDNLTTTGRTTIPAWAVRASGLAAAQAGAPVNATYPIGRYLEDNAYLGDLGQTHGVNFDLNEWNARWCVTPEFPSGTWAYFVTIHANGAPAFPYHCGRSYFGSPIGNTVTAIAEPVNTTFIGGPFKETTGLGLSVTQPNVTLTWNGTEGGTYQIEASDDLATWTNLIPTVIAAGDDDVIVTETNGVLNQNRRFYRTTRTGLATFDQKGMSGTYFTAAGNAAVAAPGGTVTRGSTYDVTISFTTAGGNPGNVPTNVMPTSVTLAGTIAGTTFSRPATNQVKATFIIPAGAPTGLQTIFIQFPMPSFTVANALTIN